MRDFRCYALDMDGTINLGETVIPGVPEVLATLRGRGARLLFLTNNSSQTVTHFRERFERMGIEAYDEEIVTSSTATAAYLAENGLRTAFTVGEDGLRANLRLGGIEVVESAPAAAVVVGICRHDWNYELLRQACSLIRDGARFVATNEDATFPGDGGEIFPAAGAMVAAVRAGSGVEPVVVGKPSPMMLQMGLARFGIAPEDTVMIGDRIDTDIDCGLNAGATSILVTTGVDQTAPPGIAAIHSLRELL